MAGASGDARVVPEGVAGAASTINDLPNDVLIRAISFLGARQLVQTCVLSTRWRDLWRSVPRINASRDEFHGTAGTERACDVLFKKFTNRFLMLRNPVALEEFRLQYNIPEGSEDPSRDEFHGTAGTERACDVLFKKFTNRFLMLRNPVALEEFRLQYNIPEGSEDPNADSEDANIWICHALQSNARSVEVFGGFLDLELDPAVFASKCYLVTSMQLSLAFLKPPFFRNLQTGCPVLERLILRGCTIFDPEISSHTLKVLTMDHDCHCTFEGLASISIPSLVTLDFFPHGARIPLLENMESLVTASVSVGTDDTHVDDICQFLRSLSGVTELEFNYRGTTLEMEQNLQWCPKFNNLTTLTLNEWCLYEDFYPLIVFLQNSPNLEQLTLKLTPRFRKFNLDQRFIGDLEERSFTCEHLVKVDIVLRICGSDLKGSKDDPVLKRLVELLRDNGITPDQIVIKDKLFPATLDV